MIPPRRSATSADPQLITGVLGAVALLRGVRAQLAELAADGDRAGGDGAARDPGAADDPEAAAVVDVVLGVAALAEMLERRLVTPRGPPAADDPPEPREPIHLLVKELLR